LSIAHRALRMVSPEGQHERSFTRRRHRGGPRIVAVSLVPALAQRGGGARAA
jgi:hypothetical protein